MSKPYVIQDSANRVTIALEEYMGYVFMGVSLCHPKDQFQRKIGYHKATGLLSSRAAIVLGDAQPGWEKRVPEVLREILDAAPGSRKTYRQRIAMGDALVMAGRRVLDYTFIRQ